MAQQATTSRSLHDLGLAAWFGGSLMGAVGLNGATTQVTDPRQAGRVANEGWARWQPVNGAAIAAHLIGSLGLINANKGRLAGQRGAAAINTLKAALTLLALAASAYSGVLGRRLRNAEESAGLPVEDATTPTPGTDPQAADAQRELSRLQWVIPALTGTLIVLAAKAGEQQRPASVARGVWERMFAND